ncbi:hypothetical protein BFW38_16885 [Terasakiispira papahanaumokuakeensis]|uniref:Uncharacterized protein n=1 Tax=Terasakiispira papahanaumokuakeensis TaxID=197479 RepID=A0A1E2VD63_9GAMM|nr:hypothetical protein BFW38_16885 [Terasakiispira papahanaumokuakeensis]
MAMIKVRVRLIQFLLNIGLWATLLSNSPLPNTNHLTLTVATAFNCHAGNGHADDQTRAILRIMPGMMRNSACSPLPTLSSLAWAFDSIMLEIVCNRQ